mmetsp:Transcript_5569/g.9145  ORF Transcript_5569/g.9145 Transcript_5569/m.9145 type:complete len:91 (+) Transcript_5569:4228-4500(+)
MPRLPNQECVRNPPPIPLRSRPPMWEYGRIEPIETGKMKSNQSSAGSLSIRQSEGEAFIGAAITSPAPAAAVAPAGTDIGAAASAALSRG